MDHRVEPPSWLPQGAAPQAADPEADEAPAPDDAHAPQDDSTQADSAAEEFSNGNRHDGVYTYTRDDSYSYGQEGSYRGRGPFEEPVRPPFDELPGAGYDPSPAPPPPGDELVASSFGSSEVTAGLAEEEFGSSAADTGLADGGFSGGAASADLADEAFGSGMAGTGVADGAPAVSETYPAAGEPYPAAGEPYPAGGEPYPAAFYAAGFPVDPPSTVAAAPQTGSQDQQRTGSTTYAYPPPPAPARVRQAAAPARRANLVVARLEPWSVMKFSFLISLVAWLVLFVAVALLYYALSSLGVFASLQKTLASVTSSQGSSGIDLSKWTSGTRVLGYTMLIGAVDVVLITALSTVGAVVYNLVTHLGGGIEITLKETE